MQPILRLNPLTGAVLLGLTLALADCPERRDRTGSATSEQKQRIYDEVKGRKRSAQGRGFNTGDD